jgi:hypothetical protein
MARREESTRRERNFMTKWNVGRPWVDARRGQIFNGAAGLVNEGWRRISLRRRGVVGLLATGKASGKIRLPG